MPVLVASSIVEVSWVRKRKHLCSLVGWLNDKNQTNKIILLQFTHTLPII